MTNKYFYISTYAIHFCDSMMNDRFGRLFGRDGQPDAGAAGSREGVYVIGNESYGPYGYLAVVRDGHTHAVKFLRGVPSAVAEAIGQAGVSHALDIFGDMVGPVEFSSAVKQLMAAYGDSKAYTDDSEFSIGEARDGRRTLRMRGRDDALIDISYDAFNPVQSFTRLEGLVDEGQVYPNDCSRARNVVRKMYDHDRFQSGLEGHTLANPLKEAGKHIS